MGGGERHSRGENSMSKVSGTRSSLAYSGSCGQFCRTRAKEAEGGPQHVRWWDWNGGEQRGLENGQVPCAVLRSSDAFRWPLIGRSAGWFAWTHCLQVYVLSHIFAKTDMHIRHTYSSFVKSTYAWDMHAHWTHIPYTYWGDRSILGLYLVYIQAHSPYTHIEDMYPKQMCHGHVAKHAGASECIHGRMQIYVYSLAAHIQEHLLRQHTPKVLSTQTHEEGSHSLSVSACRTLTTLSSHLLSMSTPKHIPIMNIHSYHLNTDTPEHVHRDVSFLFGICLSSKTVIILPATAGTAAQGPVWDDIAHTDLSPPEEGQSRK